MLRILFIALTLASWSLPAAAQTAPANMHGRAYKVAFWYESDQPVSTLKYQVYDVTRGQYDEKAVDLWFRGITDHDPKHGAYIRDLNTEGKPGATEADRLNSALEQEKERWAELQRQPLRPVPHVAGVAFGLTGSIGSGMIRRNPTGFDRPAPGSPGPVSNLPTSPFPYPYRSGPR